MLLFRTLELKKALVLARAFGRGVFRADFKLAEGSEHFGDSFLEVIDNRGNINVDPVSLYKFSSAGKRVKAVIR